MPANRLPNSVTMPTPGRRLSFTTPARSRVAATRHRIRFPDYRPDEGRGEAPHRAVSLVMSTHTLALLVDAAAENRWKRGGSLAGACGYGAGLVDKPIARLDQADVLDAKRATSSSTNSQRRPERRFFPFRALGEGSNRADEITNDRAAPENRGECASPKDGRHVAGRNRENRGPAANGSSRPTDRSRACRGSSRDRNQPAREAPVRSRGIAGSLAERPAVPLAKRRCTYPPRGVLKLAMRRRSRRVSSTALGVLAAATAGGRGASPCRRSRRGNRSVAVWRSRRGQSDGRDWAGTGRSCARPRSTPGDRETLELFKMATRLIRCRRAACRYPRRDLARLLLALRAQRAARS